MNFLFAEEGIEPPEHPHFVCTGAANLSGRGWAWHTDPRRWRCFSGDITAPADLVARAIGPTGIDAMLAIAELGTGLLMRIFRKNCNVCGSNHYCRAAQVLRAVEHIHPDAIGSLRDANVPEYLLFDPFFQDEAEHIPSEKDELAKLLTDRKRGKAARRTLRLRDHIPVWRNNSAKTRILQIGYAHQYRLKKGL